MLRGTYDYPTSRVFVAGALGYTAFRIGIISLWLLSRGAFVLGILEGAPRRQLDPSHWMDQTMAWVMYTLGIVVWGMVVLFLGVGLLKVRAGAKATLLLAVLFVDAVFCLIVNSYPEVWRALPSPSIYASVLLLLLAIAIPVWREHRKLGPVVFEEKSEDFTE